MSYYSKTKKTKYFEDKKSKDNEGFNDSKRSNKQYYSKENKNPYTKGESKKKYYS